jgi:calcineurin-like phosphoesterase family protein
MECVVSDLHLDHGNVIEYCDRPFESVAEMHEAFVENWNATVDPGEEVLFVGDLTVSTGAEELLHRLDGRELGRPPSGVERHCVL